MSEAVKRTNQENKTEALAWFFISGLILAFPLLFFACVYFPILIGWTPTSPYP